MNLGNKRLTPYLVELTQDVCLKAFWRKASLRRFLKQHRIADTQLASWAENETKRMYLQGLFDALLRQSDNSGQQVIFNMAHSLSEMKTFPDLENWEDSKEKIESAYRAVQKLRPEVQKVASHLADQKNAVERKKRARKAREEALMGQQSLQKIQDDLNELILSQGTQQGGYDFEAWLYQLFCFFELQCRRPYKDSHGRQIDGSITLDGTTFLVEAKFCKEPVGSPEIDSVLSKIQRKADNTMGIMISMSGFNENAISNASIDRTPLLLMDYSHLYNLVLSGVMSLPEVIQRVWRHASQTGQSFLAVTDFSG
jgi:hypothetical protein